jgi:hypothetical protein
VAECNYEHTGCGGGNIWLSTNYLAQYGAVLESCDPYVAGEEACRTGCPPQKVVDEMWALSGQSPVAPSILKQWLYEYGPLYVTLDSGSTDPVWKNELDNYDGSYTLYRPYSGTPDHAVLLVGYDDALAHAGGQGAWIVKNSWGRQWGGTAGFGSESGYFTIAYGSAGIGGAASFIQSWHQPNPQEVLLHHDSAGMQAAWGYQGSTEAWGAAELVPLATGCVQQVEFWTVDSTSDVDLYIYDAFDGNGPSQLLWSRENLSFPFGGYHHVDLGTPLQVSSGNALYVVAHIRNVTSQYAMPIDTLSPASPGRSWVSSNGQPGTWADLGTHPQTPADVGLRLRMAPCADAPTPTATATQPVATLTPTTTKPAVTPTTTPQPTLLYSDDFQDPGSGWYVGENDNSVAAYVNGEYQIRLKRPDWYQGATAGVRCSDCAIEADVRFVSPSGEGSGGIMFGITDDWDSYLFRIGGAGAYSLYKKTSVVTSAGLSGAMGADEARLAATEWVELVPWTRTSDLNPMGQWNRLRVVRVGSSITLYVNGQPLDQVQDGTFTGNLRVGLTASSYDTQSMDVRFERYRVYSATEVPPAPVRGWAHLPLIVRQIQAAPPTATPRPTFTPIPPGAPTATIMPTPTQVSGWVTVINEGFEGSWPKTGWLVVDDSQTDGGEYLWAPDDTRAHSGGMSIWPARGGADGVDPAQSVYPDNLDTWIVYGPFDLSDATAADMTFYAWAQIEDDYDGFFWGASTDGASFDGYIARSDSAGWVEVPLDLASWLGESEVYVGFDFQSDESLGDEGVWVDDVLVRKYVGVGAAPRSWQGLPLDATPATRVLMQQ